MSNTTKMPERVFVSAEAVMDFAIDIRSECQRDRDDCFPTEYIRADLATAEKSSVDQSGWVKCSERMPEDNKSVIVWCPENKCQFMAIYEHNTAWWLYFVPEHRVITQAVTHWRPRPENPQEGE